MTDFLDFIQINYLIKNIIQVFSSIAKSLLMTQHGQNFIIKSRINISNYIKVKI